MSGRRSRGRATSSFRGNSNGRGAGRGFGFGHGQGHGHGYGGGGVSKSVEPGVSGLLFTCSGNEWQAVREAYNLIDEVIDARRSLADAVEGDQKAEDVGTDGNKDDGKNAGGNETSKKIVDEEEKVVEDEEDAADSLKRFCENVRDGKSTGGGDSDGVCVRRVRQCRTGVNNCLFFAIDNALNENVCELADAIVALANERPCCRLLQRVWPIEATCQLDLAAVNQEVTKLVSRHFVADALGNWPSFSIEFKARNNDCLKRADALSMALDAVEALAPACRTNLSDPDVSLLFQVVRKTVMLSCVKGFVRRRRMSLHREDENKKMGKGDADGGGDDGRSGKKRKAEKDSGEGAEVKELAVVEEAEEKVECKKPRTEEASTIVDKEVEGITKEETEGNPNPSKAIEEESGNAEAGKDIQDVAEVTRTKKKRASN